MENRGLRALAKEKKVKWWEVAEYLEMGESTLCRHLRRELPDDQKTRISDAINAVYQANTGRATVQE